MRRFTRANTIHPTYQAMIEVGRAQRTMFAVIAHGVEVTTYATTPASSG
ncbi:MAG TPA: hypothetical protein VHH52_12370, partial [Pseudonocardiaceae bacterium]|nr:hypothetical protein [Pseudonocardiaceae bacterium]